MTYLIEEKDSSAAQDRKAGRPRKGNGPPHDEVKGYMAKEEEEEKKASDTEPEDAQKAEGRKPSFTEAPRLTKAQIEAGRLTRPEIQSIEADLKEHWEYFRSMSGSGFKPADSDPLLSHLNRFLKEHWTSPEAREVTEGINRLRAEISEKTKALLEKDRSGKEYQNQIDQLRLALQQLQEKQSLSHLLSRVGIAAQEKLLSSPDFRKLFEQEEPNLSYVLSIDIRRSTELMLKARNPRLYAKFVTDLAAICAK